MPYLIQEKGLGRKIKINTCRFFCLLLISHNDAAASARAYIDLLCFFCLSCLCLTVRGVGPIPETFRVCVFFFRKIATNHQILGGVKSSIL